MCTHVCAKYTPARLHAPIVHTHMQCIHTMYADNVYNVHIYRMFLGLSGFFAVLCVVTGLTL